MTVGVKQTKNIHIRRAIPQGALLSPTLFNWVIDFIYEEVCDLPLPNKLG